MIKNFAITAGFKKCKSIIKKKNKKLDKIVLVAKTKLNRIGAYISKDLINSNISHDEFVSVSNMLKEYDDIKKEIKNLKTYTVYQRLKFLYRTVLS